MGLADGSSEPPGPRHRHCETWKQDWPVRTAASPLMSIPEANMRPSTGARDVGFLLALGGLLVLVTTAEAGPPGRGKGRGHGPFHGGYAGLPPGLAKKPYGLPPGQAKKLYGSPYGAEPYGGSSYAETRYQYDSSSYAETRYQYQYGGSSYGGGRYSGTPYGAGPYGTQYS